MQHSATFNTIRLAWHYQGRHNGSGIFGGCSNKHPPRWALDKLAMATTHVKELAAAAIISTVAVFFVVAQGHATSVTMTAPSHDDR